MSYTSVSEITKKLYLAHSCSYLIEEWKCAGGDYCQFTYGHLRMCCFICPLFENCPDKTGICTRFKEQSKPDN